MHLHVGRDEVSLNQHKLFIMIVFETFLKKTPYCFFFKGKCSVLHLLLHVGHEILEDLNGMALDLVLSNDPDLEHRNMEKKTALIIAVESHSEKSVEKLVSSDLIYKIASSIELKINILFLNKGLFK